MAARRMVLGALGLASLAVLARARLMVVRVDGTSMLPTYQAEDALLAVRRRGARPVPLGTVVICRLPADIAGPRGYLVKRVVAVAGDPLPGADGARVPPGRVFLVGDGPGSYDSRVFGPIGLEHLHGVVLGRRAMFRPEVG